MSTMTEQEFKKIHAKLPAGISAFYTQLRNEFDMDHAQAYRRTLQLAKECGMTGRLQGLPAHESPRRLLLQSELNYF
jgi:hypothetical protein